MLVFNWSPLPRVNKREIFPNENENIEGKLIFENRSILFPFEQFLQVYFFILAIFDADSN